MGYINRIGLLLYLAVAIAILRHEISGDDIPTYLFLISLISAIMLIHKWKDSR